MKKFFALDWYEDWNDPYFIGDFDTEEEAEAACDKFEEETDGECDCIIYPSDNPKYKKIIALIEAKITKG